MDRILSWRERMAYADWCAKIDIKNNKNSILFIIVLTALYCYMFMNKVPVLVVADTIVGLLLVLAAMLALCALLAFISVFAVYSVRNFLFDKDIELQRWYKKKH